MKKCVLYGCICVIDLEEEKSAFCCYVVMCSVEFILSICDDVMM